MDDKKKSLIIHYLTKLILVIIGLSTLMTLLSLNTFSLSLKTLSLWVFIFNGVLFTYWLWINQSKIWEKYILGSYFIIIEIIISTSFTSAVLNG